MYGTKSVGLFGRISHMDLRDMLNGHVISSYLDQYQQLLYI